MKNINMMHKNTLKNFLVMFFLVVMCAPYAHAGWFSGWFGKGETAAPATSSEELARGADEFVKIREPHKNKATSLAESVILVQKDRKDISIKHLGKLAQYHSELATAANPEEAWTEVADPEGPETAKERIPELSGKRVALLVHGYASRPSELNQLAQFIHENYGPTGTRGQRYDVIIAYDYGNKVSETLSDEPLGEDLDRYIGELKDVQSIEVFAHSNGGLISRQMLEKGRHSAGIYRLVTFGTPHDGVPLSRWITNFIRWAAAEDRAWGSVENRALYDLINSSYGENISGFTKRLNEGHFSEKNPELYSQREYYAFVGNNPANWQGGLGWFLQKYFNLFQSKRSYLGMAGDACKSAANWCKSWVTTPDEPSEKELQKMRDEYLQCDGLVPMRSAGWKGLETKAGKVERFEVDSNHSRLVGTEGTGTLCNDVQEHLPQVIDSWDSNEYANTIGERNAAAISGKAQAGIKSDVKKFNTKAKRVSGEFTRPTLENDEVTNNTVQAVEAA